MPPLGPGRWDVSWRSSKVKTVGIMLGEGGRQKGKTNSLFEGIEICEDLGYLKSWW